MQVGCLVDAVAFDSYHNELVAAIERNIGLIADGTYHIVETGGFSFAGLYACDKDLIVQAVSAVAMNICSNPTR